MSRTARRVKVTKPIEVQIAVSTAITPVTASTPVEPVAMSVTCSVVNTPPSPSGRMSPGMYESMTPIRPCTAAGLPPSHSPTPAKATRLSSS